MSRFLTAAAAVTFGLTMAAAPIFAQDEQDEDGIVAPDGERVNQLIVYGEDPCPASTDNEITVCARKPEAERYRIPKPLRGIDSPQARAWTDRVEAYETVGSFGTLSCSPVGAGGSLGCTQDLIDKAYAEKANGSDVKFSDASAAAQQKRVEEAEKAYFAQDKKQQSEDAAAEDENGNATVESPVQEPETEPK